MTHTNEASATRDTTATVGEIYAAFGRGDVPGVQSYLSDDVSRRKGGVVPSHR